MRGTWRCLTTDCSMHGEGEWKAVNTQAEKHGKAESHSTTVAYIYPPELGKYPPERYQPSARTDAEVTAAAAVREAIIAGLRRCRVEDGSPAALIREDDHRHIAHMVYAALRDADLLADPNLTAERDRARDIAVALEGQVAALEGVEADRWDEGHAQGVIDAQRVHGPDKPEMRLLWVLAVTPTDDNPYRAALDPEPADRGTGRP